MHSLHVKSKLHTAAPQGVLYSHRSNYLHALNTLVADCVPLASASNVLMVVPMFHANSWGLAFAALMTGARLVLPGPHLDGESIYNLMDNYKVRRAAALQIAASLDSVFNS